MHIDDRYIVLESTLMLEKASYMVRRGTMHVVGYMLKLVPCNLFLYHLNHFGTAEYIRHIQSTFYLNLISQYLILHYMIYT